MKQVLISIQPKWVEKICNQIGKKNGKPIYEKVIEVRKTIPKLETPFKCYIYCTQTRKTGDTWTDGMRLGFDSYRRIRFCNYLEKEETFNGKVIGEFVCDKVFDITPEFGKFEVETQYVIGWKFEEDDSCLSWEDYHSYLGRKKGFGWHISNLKIYDKPKELSEFRKYSEWLDMPITRPPQSWCYVEGE